MARAVRFSNRFDPVLSAVAPAVAGPPRMVLPLNLREADRRLAPAVARRAARVACSSRRSAGAGIPVSASPTSSPGHVSRSRNCSSRRSRPRTNACAGCSGSAASCEWGFISARGASGRGRIGEDFTITLTRRIARGVASAAPWSRPRESSASFRRSIRHEPGDPVRRIPTFGSARCRRTAAPSGSSILTCGDPVRAQSVTPPERCLLELRGVAVPEHAQARHGDRDSSGLGGIYPRGIPIGTVLGEFKTSEGWARTYLLRPAVDPPECQRRSCCSPGARRRRLRTCRRSTISSRLGGAADRCGG